MDIKKIISNHKNKILLSLIWLLSFLPTNINPEDIFDLNSLVKIRLFFPFVIILFLSIYLLRTKNNILNNKEIFIKLIFIIYVLLGILFTLFNSDINSYLNLFWGLAMLIPYFYIFAFDDKFNQLKFFLIFSLLLIFFVFLFYIIQIFYQAYLQSSVVHLYGISNPDLYYFKELKDPPRSSGLSRMAIILYIALSTFLILNNNNHNNLFNIITLIISVLIGAIGLAFQSRTMNFIFIFFIALLTFICFKKKILFKNKYLVLLIFLPLILSTSYNYYSFYKTSDLKYFNTYKSDILKFSQIITVLENTLNRSKQENFSSNRFENWKKVLTISKKNIIKGYGFQADRKFIQQSVHNVYLYSLICGGMLSMLIIIIISIRSAWTSFFILFSYTYSNKNIETTSLTSAFLMILLLQRSLLETSYGVYSIDYLFFLICFFMNEINYKKYYFNKT
jgi:hypothetical protein